MAGVIEGAIIAAGTKIVGSAISSAGTAFFQKIIRLRKVDQAIKGARGQSEPVDKAISDFEYVIGAFYGELTEGLERFLLELSRSGLISAMAELAILKRRSVPVQKAFVQLHNETIGTNEGDANALFERLMVSLEVSFEYLAKDRTVAFLIRAASDQLEARLDGISEKLEALLCDNTEFSLEDVDGTLQKLLPRLANSFKDLPIETHRGLRKKDIQQLYTPSRLRHRNDRLIKGTLDLGSVTIKGRPLQKADAVEVISYSEFRSCFKRVVVLGDPGGGKSTLCQYLCYDLAKQSTQSINFPDKANDFLASLQRIPIRVVLRSYENARSTEPQLGIFTYILRDLQASNASIDPKKLLTTLKYCLVYGRAVLAFDGLDEILDTAKRREFVDIVAGFCDEFPLCPVIVTSRIVGYEDAPLSEHFEELTLEKFERSEINEYLIKFLKVVTEKNKVDAERLAKDFLTQTDRSATDLRQNPLMLGLMAYLFAMTGDVPSNRPEIYKECATLMFEKWDQNRDIRANIPSDVDLLDLFSVVAAQIFGKSDLEEGVSSHWIRLESEKYFRTRYESKDKALAAAKEIAPFITGRSWVMSEFGADVYKFTHRTFLEYFYARNLCERFETVSQLIPILKTKIADGQWSVIAHLALQLKVSNNSTRTGQALSSLVSLCRENKKSTKTKANLVRFTAEALEYLPGSEFEIKPVVTHIVQQCAELANSNFSRAIEIIGECCNAAPQRRQYVESVIADSIIEVFSASNGAIYQLLSYLIVSECRESFFMRDAIKTTLPDAVTTVVKAAVKARIRELALTDRKVGLCYWVWYQDSFEAIFDAFGFELFARGNQIQFMPSYPEPVAYMLIGAIAPGMIQDLHLFDSEPQKDAIRHIGRQSLRANEMIHSSMQSNVGNGLSLALPVEVWVQLFWKSRQDIWLFRGCLAILLYCTYRDGVGPISSQLSVDEGRERLRGETVFQVLDPEIVNAIERTMRKFGGANSPQFEFYRDWCGLRIRPQR